MTDTVILIAVAVVAFVIGCGLGYYLTAGRERRADQRAERREAEMAAYRGNVTEHFRETAVKFRQLGEQYRALHEHLADGAEALCDVPDKGAKLEFSPLGELEAPRSTVAPGAAAMAATAASAAAGDDADETDATSEAAPAEAADETDIVPEAKAVSTADETEPSPAEPSPMEDTTPEERSRREAAPATGEADAEPASGGQAADAESSSEPATRGEGEEPGEEEAPKQPVDFAIETGDAGREAKEDESGRRTIH